MEKVGIVDYGMGNLASVRNAFLSIGAEAEILSKPDSIGLFSHIVLPGVGAFGDGISNLRDRGWIPELEKFVLGKKIPFLGICLGMQLLAEKGTENGNFEGLGWVGGDVVKFEFPESSLRVPYFVHSYYLVPKKLDDVLLQVHYGIEFSAAVAHNNIVGVQFHPEKSHRFGKTLLSSFIRWNP